MNKQVLSVEQMQHLQELGLELKPTMLHYTYNNLIEDKKWYLTVLTSSIFEQIPTYTLQDILDTLPEFIYDDGYNYYLNLAVDSVRSWCASYDSYDIGTTLEYFNDETPIDAAYGLLCWAIENGYVKINKNK